jgi:hypothetical protein
MPIPTTEQIAAYETIPAKIEVSIKGLSDKQLLQRPTPEDWSIHEVILHLPDSETFVYERLRRVLAEERPILHAFAESLWAQNLEYRRQDYRLALALFKAQREANAALLRQLPTEAWQRMGVHTENGEMSLYDIFTTYLRHGEVHFRQIEQIKEQL